MSDPLLFLLGGLLVFVCSLGVALLREISSSLAKIAQAPIRIVLNGGPVTIVPANHTPIEMPKPNDPNPASARI